MFKIMQTVCEPSVGVDAAGGICGYNYQKTTKGWLSFVSIVAPNEKCKVVVIGIRFIVNFSFRQPHLKTALSLLTDSV